MKGEEWISRLLLTGIVMLGLATVPASAGQRPLSDFLSQQGAWCFTGDCVTSYYGGPDCASGGSSFTFPQYWGDSKNDYIGGFDTLGQLEIDRVTTVNGSVSESARPNGLADVDVLLHSSNALARAFTFDANSNVVELFGHAYFEVQNGAPPTLGDAFVRVTLTNTALGAALPDFNQLAFCPLPGQALNFLSISAQASGPLRAGFGVPEGTPGRLEVSQTGPFATSAIANPHSKVFNTFPAANVIIRQTGQ